MKKVVIGVALAVALVAGYFGYEHWAFGQAVASIRPHVRMASLQTTAVLEFEAGKGAPSYAEYFKRSADVVAELDKVILSIRAEASPRAAVSRDGAIEYVRTAQDVIREMARGRRNILSAQVAQDSAREATDEAASASDYARKYALERATAALGRARTAWAAVDKSMRDADARFGDLERQSEWAGRTFGAESAISPELLKAVKENRKR